MTNKRRPWHAHQQSLLVQLHHNCNYKLAFHPFFTAVTQIVLISAQKPNHWPLFLPCILCRGTLSFLILTQECSNPPFKEPEEGEGLCQIQTDWGSFNAGTWISRVSEHGPRAAALLFFPENRKMRKMKSSWHAEWDMNDSGGRQNILHNIM